MTTAYLNRIATAVPEHDVHDAFAAFAEMMLADPRLRTVFRRMVSRAEIAHRYSFLDPYVATVMFVLQRMMQQARPGQQGCAMSFGPGLTAETMRFHAV